jgi:hypothetical protein
MMKRVAKIAPTSQRHYAARRWPRTFESRFRGVVTTEASASV